MSERLKGKVAIVTGSNSGIGRAIAIAFGREGAKVVCANRQEASKSPDEKDVTTHDLITQNGGEAIFMKLTFNETQSVNSVMDEVVSKYGRIDILVNNAGTPGQPGPCWALSDEAFDAVIDSNLKGTFKCMRAAAAIMIKQEPDSHGIRGKIINTGSVFGPRAMQMMIGYSASKSAIQSMTKTAAADLGPYKVLVNSVNPGTVKTAATANLPEQMEAFLRQKSLVGFGEPADVAKPVVFLASDDANWVDGADFYVDGGYMVT